MASSRCVWHAAGCGTVTKRAFDSKEESRVTALGPPRGWDMAPALRADSDLDPLMYRPVRPTPVPLLNKLCGAVTCKPAACVALSGPAGGVSWWHMCSYGTTVALSFAAGRARCPWFSGSEDPHACAVVCAVLDVWVALPHAPGMALPSSQCVQRVGWGSVLLRFQKSPPTHRRPFLFDLSSALLPLRWSVSTDPHRIHPQLLSCAGHHRWTHPRETLEPSGNRPLGASWR